MSPLKSRFQIKIILCVSLLMLVNEIFAQYNTKDKRNRYVLSMTKKFSPTAYEIFRAAGDFDYMYYFKDADTKEDILLSLGVASHETLHRIDYFLSKFSSMKIKGIGFSKDFKTGLARKNKFIGISGSIGIMTPLSFPVYDLEQERGFYIDDSLQITSTFTKSFPINKLNKIVPNAVKKKIFRYDTYVGESNVSNGIFSLIDEMSAYRIGAKVCLEVLESDKNFFKTNSETFLIKYLNNIASSLSAYSEFKLFICYYLKYTQEFLPYEFLRVNDNLELRAALTSIDQEYLPLFKKFGSAKNDFLEVLNKKGSKFDYKDDCITFSQSKNRKKIYTDVFLEKYIYFLNEQSSKELLALYDNIIFKNIIFKDNNDYRTTIKNDFVSNELKRKLDEPDEHGRTFFMKAINYQFFDIADSILMKGSNIDYQDKNGNTALMNAIINNNSNAVNYLIEKDVKIEIMNKEKESAIDLTFNIDDKEIKKAVKDYYYKLKRDAK